MATIKLKRTNQTFTLVPNNIIYKHLKDATGDEVKVLLALFMFEQKGLNPTIEDISELTGVTNFNVISLCETLTYKGIISIEEQDIEGNMTIRMEEGDSIIPSKEEEFNFPTKGDYDKNTSFFPQNSVGEDALSSLKEVIDGAEKLLGGPVPRQTMEVIRDIMDIYKFNGEVTLLIIEQGLKKVNPSYSYYETIAKNWKALGIETKEDVLEFLDEGKEKYKRYREILSYCGIKSSGIPQIYKTYIDKWCERQKMPQDVIEYAIDSTIRTINKADFAYIDKIIGNLYKKDIKNLEDAKKENEKNPIKKGAKNKKGFSDYGGQRRQDDNIDKFGFGWEEDEK